MRRAALSMSQSFDFDFDFSLIPLASPFAGAAAAVVSVRRVGVRGGRVAVSMPNVCKERLQPEEPMKLATEDVVNCFLSSVQKG